MDPITIGLIAGGAQILGSLFTKAKRPEYEIPTAMKSAVGVAASQANADSPSYQIGIQNALLAQQNSLNSPLGASVASIIQGQTNKTLADLGVQNDTFRINANRDYINILQQYARSQDKEFEMNQLAPYQDKYNEKRELMGAGISNLYNAAALSSLSGDKPLFKF
jgi:hypothetical protein